MILIGAGPKLQFDDLADALIYSLLHISVDQAQSVATAARITNQTQLSSALNTMGEILTDTAVFSQVNDHAVPIADYDQASRARL